MYSLNLLLNVVKRVTITQGMHVKIDEYYTNIYGHERLWLKQWARGDCNCAIFAPQENSTIAVTEGP